MKRRVRQIDVARLAGVSPATVSVVVNNRLDGNVRISPETQQRVLEAVDQLAYVADPAARSLAGGHNALLGVFTFEAIFPLIHRDFYYRFLVGIEEEAEKQGYDLLLFTSAGTVEGRRYIYNQGVNRLRMADGAILLGVSDGKQEVLRLVREGYPFVFVGRREVPGHAIAYVAADYAGATAEVMHYMFQHGHRRIAYLGIAFGNESQADRRTGYRLAHETAGYTPDPQLRKLLPSLDLLTPVMLNSLLQAGATAFVVETGPITPKLIESMQAMGLQAPRDISLAVLGDPMDEQSIYAETTTFSIPRRAMGANAVRLLTELLTNPEEMKTPQVVLPCTFMPGNTVGFAPGSTA